MPELAFGSILLVMCLFVGLHMYLLILEVLFPAKVVNVDIGGVFSCQGR